MFFVGFFGRAGAVLERIASGIVPNREMEGARRRAASGEGAAAWEVVRRGNTAHIDVPGVPRRHLRPVRAVLLPGHA